MSNHQSETERFAKQTTKAATNITDQVSSSAERLMDGARKLADDVSGAAADATARVRQSTHDVAERAVDAADTVSKVWADAADSDAIQSVNSFVRKYPVVALAGAVAVGILLGRLANRE